MLCVILTQRLWAWRCLRLAFVGEVGKAKMWQCLGGELLSLSLSLSLSRCSHFLARLWAKFKGLFYLFHRSFISFNRKFFLFHRSFFSSFYLQKAFFRTLCFFEIFKCFVFGLFALVIASLFTRKAHFVILSLCKKAKNPHKLKENLPFLDTSLALSMTKFMTQRVFGMARQIGMINLGCRLNLIVCHALILSKFAMTEKWQVLVWNLWIFMWILEKNLRNLKNLKGIKRLNNSKRAKKIRNLKNAKRTKKIRKLKNEQE